MRWLVFVLSLVLAWGAVGEELPPALDPECSPPTEWVEGVSGAIVLEEGGTMRFLSGEGEFVVRPDPPSPDDPVVVRDARGDLVVEWRPGPGGTGGRLRFGEGYFPRLDRRVDGEGFWSAEPWQDGYRKVVYEWRPESPAERAVRLASPDRVRTASDARDSVEGEEAEGWMR